MAEQIPVHELLVAFLRSRSDRNMNQLVTFKRACKRLVHWWCQSVEQKLEALMLTQCPDVTVSAKYHPFLRGSRAKGNKSLTLTLVARFQARPGGYISTKTEHTMHSLGLVSKGSKIAGRTSTEFCVRLLGKCAGFVQERCLTEGLRTLNFCMDAAMVGSESVTHTEIRAILFVLAEH